MDAQTVLATALTEKRVRVYWDAKVPHVRPAETPDGVGSIHLPPIPDELDPRTEQVIRAYTGHEAGHIRYTENSVALGIEDETLFAIWNYIEDGRINKLVGDQFYGLKQDLDVVYEDSAAELKQKIEENAEKGQKFSAVLRGLGVLTYIGMDVDDEKIKRWSMLDEDVVTLLDAIPDVIERIPDLRSSADALECAEIVYKRWKQTLLNEAPPPPPPGHERAAGSSGGGEGDGEPDGGFPFPTKTPGKRKKKGKKPGEEEDSDEGGEKTDGDPASGGEEKRDGSGGKEEDKKAREDKKPRSRTFTSDDDDEPRPKKTIKDEEFYGDPSARKARPDDERPEDLDAGPAGKIRIDEKRPERTPKALEEAAKALREAAELSQTLTIGARLEHEVSASIERTYRDAREHPELVYVAWREQDEIVEVSRDPNRETQNLYEDARHRISYLRGRLFMELLGIGPIWARNQTRGKIDDRALYRAQLKDKHVFKKKRPRPVMNTAIEFIIDYSGSMAEHPDLPGIRGSHIPKGVVPKVDLAIKLAMVFSESCELLDVPNEVTAFTTNPIFVEPIGQPGVFTRWEPLRLMVVKPFAMRFKQCVHAFTNAKRMGMYNNVDGESILWAARRLSMREEENLVLIVLSDGMPHANGCDMDGIAAHLTSVVQRVKRSGIRVLAFGINSDAVSLFYDEDFVVFHELDDLMTGGYARIAQILRSARRVSVRS